MAKTEVAVKKEHAIALAGAFETDAHAGFDGMYTRGLRTTVPQIVDKHIS